MVEIATTISHGASSSLLYDIHHIARSVLHMIEEDQRIAAQNEEASTSHGPSIRPLASSTIVRMQPIRGQGIELVNWPTEPISGQPIQAMGQNGQG